MILRLLLNLFNMKSKVFFDKLHNMATSLNLNEIKDTPFPPSVHLHKVHLYVRVPPRVLKGDACFRDIFRIPTVCHLRHFVTRLSL